MCKEIGQTAKYSNLVSSYVHMGQTFVGYSILIIFLRSINQFKFKCNCAIILEKATKQQSKDLIILNICKISKANESISNQKCFNPQWNNYIIHVCKLSGSVKVVCQPLGERETHRFRARLRCPLDIGTRQRLFSCCH